MDFSNARIIVRHAHREAITLEQRDPPITERGKRESIAFGRWLRGVMGKSIERLKVYHTPYTRTRETALFIAEGAGIPKERVKEKGFPWWWLGKREDLIKLTEKLGYEGVLREWVEERLLALPIRVFGERVVRMVGEEEPPLLLVAHDSTVSAIAYYLDIEKLMVRQPHYLEGIVLGKEPRALLRRGEGWILNI